MTNKDNAIAMGNSIGMSERNIMEMTNKDNANERYEICEIICGDFVMRHCSGEECLAVGEIQSLIARKVSEEREKILSNPELYFEIDIDIQKTLLMQYWYSCSDAKLLEDFINKPENLSRILKRKEFSK